MIENEKLHAYADGELSHFERAAVEQQLATCPNSRAELESIQRMKDWIRTSAQPVEASDPWSRCQSRLSELREVDRSGRFIANNGWALAAVVAVVIGVGGWMSRQNQSRSLSSADLAGALFSSRSVSPAVQKRNANLDEMLRQADMTLRQLRPVGMREISVNGYAAQEVLLSDVEGQMRLLILPQEATFDSMEQVSGTPYFCASLQENVNAVAWHNDRYAFVLVGNRAIKNLIEIARTSSPL